MTTAGLQKKIAGVLGVSSSEKELAFEIFVLKVCEILTEDVTLKVHRIGFFQLKKNSSADSCTLLFIPLSEDLYRESKNLFLTIPLPSRHNKENDLDSDVFSIGVGKPILPLTGNDENDAETSYAILRKSIEERVNEILAESDQMPNFNIWDDYYKSVKYVEHPTKDKLNDLNADSEFKEEFLAEDLAKNLIELSSDIDDEGNEKYTGESGEVSLKDLLADLNIEDELIETESPKAEEPEIDEGEEQQTIEEDEFELLSPVDEPELSETEYREFHPVVDEPEDDGDLESALQQVIDDVERKFENINEDLTEVKFSEDISEGNSNTSENESEDINNVVESLKNVGEDFSIDMVETETDIISQNLSSESEQDTEKDEIEAEENENDELNEVVESLKSVDENINDENEEENTVETKEPEVRKHSWSKINEVVDNLKKNIEEFDKEIGEDKKEEKISFDNSAGPEEKIEAANEHVSDFNEGILDSDLSEKEDEISEIIAGLAGEYGEQIDQAEDDSTAETDEQTDESLEIRVPTQKQETFYEIKHEAKLDEVDLEKVNDEDIEPSYYLGLKKKEDEPIEWDWGDELKEEFGVEFLKDDLSQTNDDFEDGQADKDKEKALEETIDDIFKTTQHAKPDLFEELESTVKKEIKETEEYEDEYEFEEPIAVDETLHIERPLHIEKPLQTEEDYQILEYSGEPRRYNFVEEEKLEAHSTQLSTNYPTGTRFETTDEISENDNENENGFSFGKWFVIIFSSFVVVVLVIAYLFMNRGVKQDIGKTPTSTAAVDSFSLKQPSVANKNDSAQINNGDLSNFPRVASLRAKDATNPPPTQSTIQPTVKKSLTNNGLFRTLGTDDRVTKNIYFDGREYNFQVSSWRNKLKAEQEVQRLRGKGYDAFATEVFLPQKGGTWFRVRIGSFKTREEAEQFFTKNTF